MHALDGLDLVVPRGTVTALLGPNGAGKTTTVKVLTTSIRPDHGTATIDGIDVIAHPDRIRPIIGVSGQYAAVDENLTGFENLDMVGRLYHLGAQQSRARARKLISLFGADGWHVVAAAGQGGDKRGQCVQSGPTSWPRLHVLAPAGAGRRDYRPAA